MTLDQIIKDLDLKILTEKKDFSIVNPTHGYVSDMLSCVMTGAKHPKYLGNPAGAQQYRRGGLSA